MRGKPFSYSHQKKEVIDITLEQFFKENPKVALGFSGGVDSSYLLYAGLQSKANIRAYYVNTAFQPEWELQDAFKLAGHVGAELTVIEMDVLRNKKVIANPANRCYYCKMEIFTTLQKQALADGFTLVIDGTNASDDANDRPGMKALTELSIHSPLREAGITKDEVRRLSKEAGLFTWDKPAYACLATRIPTGQAITADLLHRIEKSEDILFELGFTDFRVRVMASAIRATTGNATEDTIGGATEDTIEGATEDTMGDVAKLQFPENQIKETINKKEKIIKNIKPYFDAVLLDLEGR